MKDNANIQKERKSGMRFYKISKWIEDIIGIRFIVQDLKCQLENALQALLSSRHKRNRNKPLLENNNQANTNHSANFYFPPTSRKNIELFHQQ